MYPSRHFAALPGLQACSVHHIHIFGSDQSNQAILSVVVPHLGIPEQLIMKRVVDLQGQAELFLASLTDLFFVGLPGLVSTTLPPVRIGRDVSLCSPEMLDCQWQ